MGFGEDASRNALRACNNNVEHALEMLLAGNVPDSGAEQAHMGGSEHLVRLGFSQYTFAEGSSACTPIACTLVSCVLDLLQKKDNSFLDPAVLTGIFSPPKK